MKIKSKYVKSNKANQGKVYARNKYRNYDYSSDLNSMDFYRQNRSYSVYSKYKYINASLKRSIRPNVRKSSRPVSPVLGSEEYMTKKIEQTSAIIMKQLLNPIDQNVEGVCQSKKQNEGENSTDYQTKNEIDKSSSVNSYDKGKNKKNAIYNIEEIHKKIMNHITKLNDGKKKNLINSNMSGYDTVIEQIQKQKRLEISRALRAMCSQSKETRETTDFINSIIPDMGINIEDLPQDLIEELSNTLDIDPEWSNPDLFYDHSSCEEVSLGSNKIYEENLFARFDDNTVKSIDDSAIICIQNDKNSKICDDTIVSKSKSQNVDTSININNNNNSTTHLDNGIITIVTDDTVTFEVKKEICEQDLDYCDNLYEDRNREIDNSSMVEVNSECQNSERKCGNFLYETSSNIENIAENLEKDNLNLHPISVVPTYNNQMKIFGPTKKKSNKKDNSQFDPRALSVKETNSHMIHNKIVHCTCQDTIKEKDCISMSTTSTQTDAELETHCAGNFIDYFITKFYKETPQNVSDAIRRMFEIDQCVLKLTNYRQSLFTNFNSIDSFDSIKTNMPTTTNSVFHQNITEKNDNNEHIAQNITISPKKRKKKKKRFTDFNSANRYNKIRTDCGYSVANDTFQSNCSERDYNMKQKRRETVAVVPKINSRKFCSQKRKSADVDGISNKDCQISEQDSLNFKRIGDNTQPKHLELLDLHEKILVIKVTSDKLVAGTESGKIIFCSLETGHYSKILSDCDVPITSLLFRKHNPNTTYMYVGSFDTILKIYSLYNYSVIESVPLDDKIQCMECSWDYIFIGCIGGSLLRYTPKKKVVEFGDKFSDKSILVLKAAQEGARRVLLIGSRNSPVCIRDAMTGLYMRTMEYVISPTVYSLILEKNLVYCGTTNQDILVYSFHDGKLVHRYKATSSKGIGCIKIDKNLLFASCHNGNVYVYDIKEKKFISTIKGPGGVILSMEIFENQVIIGTMSFMFMALPIPQHILERKI